LCGAFLHSCSHLAACAHKTLWSLSVRARTLPPVLSAMHSVLSPVQCPTPPVEAPAVSDQKIPKLSASDMEGSKQDM
jgi:hypothetical protein